MHSSPARQLGCSRLYDALHGRNRPYPSSVMHWTICRGAAAAGPTPDAIMVNAAPTPASADQRVTMEVLLPPAMERSLRQIGRDALLSLGTVRRRWPLNQSVAPAIASINNCPTNGLRR